MKMKLSEVQRSRNHIVFYEDDEGHLCVYQRASMSFMTLVLKWFSMCVEKSLNEYVKTGLVVHENHTD